MAATPSRGLLPAPVLGLGTRVHWLPSQRIVRVRLRLSAVEEPTAQMSLADTAATSSRNVDPGPTLGLGTTVHWLPSQCSTRLRHVPLTIQAPAAHTSSAETTAR